MKVRSARGLFVLLGAAITVASLLAACTTTEVVAPAEPLPDGTGDGGDGGVATDAAPPLDAADAVAPDASTCVARSPKGTARWVPPTPWYQNKCTRNEVAELAYYCFDSDPKLPACTTFLAQHPACTACALTKDSDPAWGPIVFFGNDIYRELNLVGCVANAEGDASASSCAAAFGLYADCARRACVGCTPVVDPQGVDFSICKDSKAVSSFCLSQSKQVASKCASLYGSPSPENPTNVCKDHASIRDYVTMWCGAPPASTDAGADAGE